MSEIKPWPGLPTAPTAPSRRSFLKSSGLAIASTVSGAGAKASEVAEPHKSTMAPLPQTERLPDLVSLVNLLQGTDSTETFSRGNTLPIAAVELQ